MTVLAKQIWKSSILSKVSICTDGNYRPRTNLKSIDHKLPNHVKFLIEVEFKSINHQTSSPVMLVQFMQIFLSSKAQLMDQHGCAPLRFFIEFEITYQKKKKQIMDQQGSDNIGINSNCM
jgi:hypothetical protein